MSILMLSSIMAISSPSWVMMWVSLEINTICMCFILGEETSKMKKSHTSSLCYLVPQMLGSMLMLMVCLMPPTSKEVTKLVILGVMIFKMGGWPVHSWFMSVTESISFCSNSLKILMTWQKMVPLMIMSMMNSNPASMILIALFSIMLTTSALNKKMSSKSIMVFSSLFYNGWTIILTCILMSLSVFLLIYWTSTILALVTFSGMEKKYHTTKSDILTNLVNIGNLSGLPPFAMFYAKVLCLSEVLWSMMKEVAIMMMLASCIFMFNYLWMSSNILDSNHHKSQLAMMKKPKLLFYTTLTLSVMGLVTIL